MKYRLIITITLFSFSCQGPSLFKRAPANGEEVIAGCDADFIKVLSSIRRGKPHKINWAELSRSLSRGEVSREGLGFENALARLNESLDEEGRVLLEKRLQSLEDFQRKKLRWRPKQRTTEEEVHAVVDALYRVSYAKVGLLSVYRFSKKRFTKASVDAYTDFLLIKHALLGDDLARYSLTSIPATVGKGTLRLFSFLLPFELGRAGVKFNKVHLRILKSKGHKGLYRYIKNTHGNLKALKYWFVHLTNVKLVGAIGLLAFIGPELYESYDFWTELLKVEIDEDASPEDLEQVLADKELTPEELKSSLISALEKSQSEEAMELKGLLESLED